MAERGDTLIEVIFATAVLALVIVLALSVMNSGTVQAQRAVEGTFVRQELDSQTEMLRFARDAYVDRVAGADTLWDAITARTIAASQVQDFTTLSTSNCVGPSAKKAFWLQANGGTVTVQTTFAAPVTYAAAGNGVWIEAASGTNYVDFYLFACWDSPNSTVKSTSGTVVRLYAPAN